MEKQTMWLIGGGALAAAGLGYYFWSKSKPATTATSQALTSSPAKPAPAPTTASTTAAASADPFQKFTQTAAQMAGQAGLPALPAGIPPLPAGADPSVASVQNALKSLGYNPGTIDGQFGPATAAALKQFQSAQNLPQTSVIDTSTIQALVAAASV